MCHKDYIEDLSYNAITKVQYDPGNYRLISLTFTSAKMTEQLLLDVISKQLEEQKVIRSS